MNHDYTHIEFSNNFEDRVEEVYVCDSCNLQLLVKLEEYVDQEVIIKTWESKI